MAAGTFQTKHKVFIGLIIFTILFSVGAWYKPYVWAEWVSGTVTEKIPKAGEVPNKILVELDEGNFVETFTNEDIGWRLKKNSGDIQANVKVGEHYEFKVSGRRSHWLSTYRNVVKYREDTEE